jgi:glycosyltransferase involved in cell wall biosynthesis
MRLLIDAHHIGARQTGNETWTRNVTRELASSATSDDFHFLASSAGRSEVQQLTGAPPILVSGSSLRRVTLDIPRAARRVAADATLVHYTAPLSRCPTVVMIHDLSPFEPASRAWLTPSFRQRVRTSIRWSVRRAAILLAPSEFTRLGILDRWSVDPDRVVVAPNAVDPRFVENLAPESVRAVPRGPRRILAVGNVLPRKNLDFLGQVVSVIRSHGRDVELRIVGQASADGRPIERKLRDLLGAHVSFSGYVSAAQLAAEYVAADVFAIPSLYEGFGIPALEAMCAGIPVVASNASALPEIVGDAGLVVDPRSIEDWVGAFERLLDDPDLRSNLVNRGTSWLTRWSWRDSAAVVSSALRAAAQ